LPLVRHLVGLIPQFRVERSNRRRRERPLTESHVPSIVLITNVGEFELDRLVFSGADLVHAFASGGGAKMPGVLAMGISAFRGSLTLSLGAGPTALIPQVSDRMMQLLPARPASPPRPDGP